MTDLTPTARLSAALDGRYRIELKIGEGGMASVYLAEIKTTANLQHPHILPLFDSGEAGGFLYYVMPCIAEENLRDRIDSLMAWPDRIVPPSDLHPDGDRFITTRWGDGSGEDEEAAEEVRYFVVTNWFQEMRARLGEGG